MGLGNTGLGLTGPMMESSIKDAPAAAARASIIRPTKLPPIASFSFLLWILDDVTIRKVCYPVTESVLQVFGPFGVVEQGRVLGWSDDVLCWLRLCLKQSIMQQKLLESCMAGVCILVVVQLDIKWGSSQECVVMPDMSC